MSFIGIDLGASFIKAAWLNPAKNTVEDVIREPFPPFLTNLPPKWMSYRDWETDRNSVV